MARKRMIDPSLWSDDGFAELTPRQQVLYIGLFSTADDAGKLKGSPTSIALALPAVYMATPLAEVAADLDAVIDRMTKVERYTVKGTVYLRFANYGDWQKIDHPSPSKLPDPVSEPFGEPSVNDQGMFPERSSLIEVNRTEEKLTEEKEKGANAPNPSPPVTRIEADWEPDETDWDYAVSKGMPEDDIPSEAETFRDWYLQQGERGLRADWPATWRSWVQREMKRRDNAPIPLRRNGRQMISVSDQIDEWAEELKRGKT